MSLIRGIYILWLMCLLVFNHTYGQQVAMFVNSTGYPPHLYRDEPIAITCTATGYTDAETVRLVDGSEVTDPHYGCAYAARAWSIGGDSSNFPGLTELDHTYCATAGAQSPPFTLSLEGNVSQAMVGLNLKCFTYLDGSAVLSTDSVTISEIRVVPPGHPTLAISGDEPKIAERKPFTFSCSPSTASPGAQPTSKYSYEVLRNGVVIANTNTYTPVEADRDVIRLRCNDSVHYDALKDKHPERVVKETELLKPWYLANNGEENRDTEMQPSAQHTLTCDVSGYPEKQITYSWTCDGCTSTDTAYGLHVPRGDRDSGQTETISCTAHLSPLTPVTITWNITWNLDVPLPTEDLDDGIGGVIGGGDSCLWFAVSVGASIGCGVTIATVFVGICIYRSKKKTSNGVTTDKRGKGGKRNSNKNGKDDESVPMYSQTASAPPGGNGTP